MWCEFTCYNWCAWNSKTLNRIAKIIGYGLLRVCLREEKLSWNYELSYLGAVNFNNELTTWQMILSVGNSPPVQATQWWIYKSITRNACVWKQLYFQLWYSWKKNVHFLIYVKSGVKHHNPNPHIVTVFIRWWWCLFCIRRVVHNKTMLEVALYWHTTITDQW
jgi:hypothetical protein